MIFLDTDARFNLVTDNLKPKTHPFNSGVTLLI